MLFDFGDLLILLQFAGSGSIPVLAGYTEDSILSSQKTVALCPQYHYLCDTLPLWNIPPRGIVDRHIPAHHILAHRRLVSCLDVRLVWREKRNACAMKSFSDRMTMRISWC